MNWTEAINSVFGGQRVARPTWNVGTYLIAKQGTPVYQNGQYITPAPQLAKVTNFVEQTAVVLPAGTMDKSLAEDTQRTDWVIIPNPNATPTPTEQFNFQEAIRRLGRGSRLKRLGWNNPNQWIVLVDPASWSTTLASAAPLAKKAFIGLKTPDDGFVPWVSTHLDTIATDWVEVIS
jgi:hypothetical protein